MAALLVLGTYLYLRPCPVCLDDQEIASPAMPSSVLPVVDDIHIRKLAHSFHAACEAPAVRLLAVPNDRSHWLLLLKERSTVSSQSVCQMISNHSTFGAPPWLVLIVDTKAGVKDDPMVHAASLTGQTVCFSVPVSFLSSLHMSLQEMIVARAGHLFTVRRLLAYSYALRHVPLVILDLSIDDFQLQV